MKQPLLLMDRYPAPPDGAAEIEREAMTARMFCSPFAS
jgi:hypothetical protein